MVLVHCCFWMVCRSWLHPPMRDGDEAYAGRALKLSEAFDAACQSRSLRMGCPCCLSNALAAAWPCVRQKKRPVLVGFGFLLVSASVSLHAK